LTKIFISLALPISFSPWGEGEGEGVSGSDLIDEVLDKFWANYLEDPL